MTFVKFLSGGKSVSIHEARVVAVSPMKSHGFVAADVEHINPRMSLFGHDGRVVLARSGTEFNTFQVIDEFHLDADKKIVRREKGTAETNFATTHAAAMLLKARKSGQKWNAGIFAACVLMCCISDTWMHLAVHAMRTNVHLAMFMATHVLKYLVVEKFPVDRSLSVKPALDSKSLRHMMWLFGVINVAFRLCACVCYMFSSYYPTMGMWTWLNVGLLTIAWDVYTWFKVY